VKRVPLDSGDPAQLAACRAIVIPGTKNTIADVRWLRASGMADAILAAAQRGLPVVGICGGYQLLGERLVDFTGVAGDAGDETGLGLLPVTTHFEIPKIVRPVTTECDGRRWTTYEIHGDEFDKINKYNNLKTIISEHLQ
jgi:adenosylcobyric acid synthase